MIQSYGRMLTKLEFSDIIGNYEIREYLKKIENISQSYLFVGTDGIGKLLIAKEFAKKILCLNNEGKGNCGCKSCKCFSGLNHPDFFVLNEEGETIKIEQVRQMISKVIEAPIISEKKVYIINDCDKMTVEAQNCLLKTLEEPPRFSVIILISARENLILNTIKSRCVKIQFKNISNDELKKYAIDKLGYTQMSEDLLESFNGSIKQAILQRQYQEQFIQINNIIDNMLNQSISNIIKDAKIIYNKEDIEDLLSYMMVYIYKKSLENSKYLDCIEKINNCKKRLKCNCNFDMCVDNMLIEMCESLQN